MNNERNKKHKAEQRKARNVKQKDGVIMPAPVSRADLPDGYANLLSSIKKRIQQERIKTVLSANCAMVMLYWDIGASILERQQTEGWGAKVIDRLSFDLKEAFLDMKGFSARNLKYMRKFTEHWPDRAIVQEVLAQIPWYHNLALMEKLKKPELQKWYARKTVENGWSRNILVAQIETRLHERIGQTTNNFELALPPADSDMASQIFKDPYVFDFLGTANPLLKRLKLNFQRMRTKNRAEKNRTTNHTNDTNRYEGLGMMHNSLNNQDLKDPTLEPW